MAYNISKYYRNILGLDLRVSDLLRSQGAATEAKNIMFRQTGALSKRMGHQITTDPNVGVAGGAGTFKYNNVEIGTGTITEELLVADDELHSYTAQTFTITYSGGTSAYYDLYLNATDGNFYFDLYKDGAQLFSQNCGNGLGASDTTVAQIKTLVDAQTGFAMTISDVGTTSIAFADLGRAVALSSGGTTTNYYTWTAIDTPGTYTTPFTLHWARRNQTDFEVISSAQLLDVMYFANGYDDLHKYDGNRIYKAGVPKPAIPTDAGAGAGSNLSAGLYKWKYTYEHTDAKQNIIVGQESDEVSYTSPGGDSRQITFTSLQEDSGYNTATAVINGNQTSRGGATNTILVDAGHDLKVGDQVYLNDTASGAVVKREVTAVTATTIAVDGAADMSLSDNDTICPIKITLWRTTAGGSTFYQIKEFVNDTTNNTTTFDDDTADGSLLVEKIDPVKLPGLPPKCRYIDVWRNQLVMTGDRENVNTVYYSDFDIESFPLDQSFVTEARLGGGNSGIKSLDNSLYVFKPRSIITVTGDLGTDTFQVDGLADDGVGCVANASIQEINGVLWFLGRDGIYNVNRQGTRDVSEMISPKFDLNYVSKRCIGHYWIEKDLYVLSFPFLVEDGSSNKYLDTTNSFIMVYDLYREAWFEWNSINMLGGMVNYNGNIYTTGAGQDPVTSNQTIYNYKFLDTGLEDDYADHDTAISFSYKTHWEAMGEPSVYKKFLRIKVHSLDGTINDFETDKFTLTVETEHDYVQGSESSLSLDFGGGALGWGNSAWGQFPWGESRLEQLTSKLKSKKAKALRVVFTNNTRHQNVLISGYELEIAAAYDLQIKE